jgi:hypothetical protein
MKAKVLVTFVGLTAIALAGCNRPPDLSDIPPPKPPPGPNPVAAPSSGGPGAKVPTPPVKGK